MEGRVDRPPGTTGTYLRANRTRVEGFTRTYTPLEDTLESVVWPLRLLPEPGFFTLHLIS